MSTYWKNQGGSDEELWQHEWETHGTCISTFDTSCYTNYEKGEELVQFFNTTVNLFKTLPTYTVCFDPGDGCAGEVLEGSANDVWMGIVAVGCWHQAKHVGNLLQEPDPQCAGGQPWRAAGDSVQQ